MNTEESAVVQLKCPHCGKQLSKSVSSQLRAKIHKIEPYAMLAHCTSCGRFIRGLNYMDAVDFKPVPGLPPVDTWPEDRCWYCEINPAQAETTKEVMLYKELERTTRGSMVTSKGRKVHIRIPRCAQCKALVHNKKIANLSYLVFPIILFGGIFIAYNIFRGVSGLANFMIFVGFFILGLVAVYQLRRFIFKSKGLDKLISKDEWWENEYPPVKTAIAQGYTLVKGEVKHSS